MKERTCCFFGHREIDDTLELRTRLSEIIEVLIVKENTDTFLFGSNSQFDSLCHKLVTKAKENHPHIRRIYVRAEYQYIEESYTAYLLQSYEDTYYPKHMTLAGRAAYIERNREMIEKSATCVIYYNPDHAPLQRKSGTKLAFDYAVKQRRKIINLYKKSTKPKTI